MKAVRSGFLAGATLVILANLVMPARASVPTLAGSATVLKHASMRVLAQPGAVVVTAGDIARGYVDVPDTAQFVVKSNAMEGYLLTFSSQGEFFREALVTGLGTNVQLGPDGGGISRKATGPGMVSTGLDLTFRFVLPASTTQGVYAWPFRLSVTPL